MPDFWRMDTRTFDTNADGAIDMLHQISGKTVQTNIWINTRGRKVQCQVWKIRSEILLQSRMDGEILGEIVHDLIVGTTIL